jgi:hypothetical protein
MFAGHTVTLISRVSKGVGGLEKLFWRPIILFGTPYSGYFCPENCCMQTNFTVNHLQLYSDITQIWGLHASSAQKSAWYTKFINVPQHQILWNSKMAVLWVVAPCSFVEVYQRFRGPCCLHHEATTQKTAIFILVAVRTSNPIYETPSEDEQDIR